MNDRVFVDSNIFLYLVRDEKGRKEKAFAILNSNPFISRRYGYSIWDCFIIATALENYCSILYSEDMQHKQVIERKLTIVNPFS